MRTAYGSVALTALLLPTFTAPDLSGPIDVPGEIEKFLPGEGADRTSTGKLPTPPPPPGRADLGRQVDGADAEYIRRAWLRTQEPGITFLQPQANAEWTEGDEVELSWETSGFITHVRIYYYGGRCRLGGRDRGMFSGYVAEQAENTGRATWKVPWVDAISLAVRIAGLGENGEKLVDDERQVRFRPRVMADLEEGTLIAVSKAHQRLYLQRDGKIARQHVVSTAAGGYWTPTMKPGSVDGRRGRMGQVFRKDPYAYSRMYRCAMPYWLAITSSGSHGIHATSPPFYWRLGGPASHGCIRQHRADAQVLFGMVNVGTPVYVFP